jgi:hypothetical protein
MRHVSHLVSAGLAATAALLGCRPNQDNRAAGPVVQRDTVGDTVVVKTVSGSVWGDSVRLVEEQRIGMADGPPEYTFGQVGPMTVASDGTLYISDWKNRWLRQYDSNGQFVRTIGRNGKGPGEFQQVMGLSFLRNGNLVVNDGSNGRLLLFSPDGKPLAVWPGKGAYAGWWARQIGLRSDTANRVGIYKVVGRPGAPLNSDGAYGFLILDSLGNPTDSLLPPPWQRSSVWGRRDFVALAYDGRLVAGFSDRYAIFVLGNGTHPLRIERNVTPVAYTTGEFAQAQKDAKDNGAGLTVSRDKPPFEAIATSDDGRILVQTPVTSVEKVIPGVPKELGRIWVEPNEVWDVFTTDGMFQGTLKLSPDAHLEMMRGDKVWGAISDKDGTQYVVRWRIEHR